MFQAPGSQSPGDEPGRNAAALQAQPRLKPADILGPDLGAAMRAGAKLTAVRTGLGLSIEDAARAMLMPPVYVEALESMNVKLLPGTGYVAPYLKRYASFLGFNLAEADALLNQFRDESALAREGARPQLRNPNSKPRRERPWIWAAAIAAVAVAFVAVKAYNATQDPRDLRAERRAEAAAAKPTQPIAPPPAPVALEQARLELRAVAAQRLDVRGEDGTVFYSREMQPGDGYLPEIGANWVVHTQNGGAFLVVLDGQIVGPLGDEGSQVLGRPVDRILATARAAAAAPAKPAAKVAVSPRRPPAAVAAPAPSGGQPAAPVGDAAPPPVQAIGATG